MKTLQPHKVEKIFCPKCGELMIKIYPWASLRIQGAITPCNKCFNKNNEKTK